MLVGCAVIPEGPHVAVMPAPGKPFEVFQADIATCMDFARQQIGVTPSEAGQQQIVTRAVIGTALRNSDHVAVVKLAWAKAQHGPRGAVIT